MVKLSTLALGLLFGISALAQSPTCESNSGDLSLVLASALAQRQKVKQNFAEALIDGQILRDDYNFDTQIHLKKLSTDTSNRTLQNRILGEINRHYGTAILELLAKRSENFFYSGNDRPLSSHTVGSPWKLNLIVATPEGLNQLKNDFLAAWNNHNEDLGGYTSAMRSRDQFLSKIDAVEQSRLYITPCERELLRQFMNESLMTTAAGQCLSELRDGQYPKLSPICLFAEIRTKKLTENNSISIEKTILGRLQYRVSDGGTVFLHGHPNQSVFGVLPK